MRDTSVGKIHGESEASEGTGLQTWHDTYGVLTADQRSMKKARAFLIPL